MKPNIEDIEAGEYVLTSLRWDEVISKPGEPFNFRRHRRGDVVELNVEDARRLVLGGAVKKKGDSDPAQTLDGPSVPPGEDPDSDPDAASASSSEKPPVHEAPARHTIADVKAYVGDDVDKAAAILALEQANGEGRSTLVKWLEELATQPATQPASPAGSGGTVGESNPDPATSGPA